MNGGLLVDGYRNRHDCTNGGASSKYREFVLTGTYPLTGHAINGCFDPTPEIPELVLVPGPLNTVRAVPRELLESGEWVMFGGNFCYTSDSRFPSDAPIKIFDRVEGRR